MAPKKKDAKKGDALTPEERAALELKQIENEKFDLSIEVTFVKEKLKQSKDENCVLVKDIDELKIRHAKAVQDYTQILQHREGQIKAIEARLGSLVAQNEGLTATLEQREAAFAKQSETVKRYEVRLADVDTLVSDKEALEEQAIKQMDTINRQTDELARLRDALAERESTLAVAQADNSELQLRASTTKWHCIMFSDAWIIETTHHRLKGPLPLDREGAALVAVPGKILMLGGHGRRDGQASEVWNLDLATMVWEQAASARMHWQTVQATTATMGTTKVLLQGGYRDGALTSEATVLSTEQWKWFQPKLRTSHPSPSARSGHALCAVRSRLFLFGGLTETGLSNELWILDLDTLSWADIPTFGAAPCARKGASLVPTEDGRKLYLVGGATAATALCDVHVLEVDNFGWSALGTVGDAPQGRESPAVSLTPPYLLVAGGSAVGEAGARVAVSDFWVLHLQQCAPVQFGRNLCCWELVDSGAWANSVVWLKPGGAYTAIRDDKVYTIKPDRDEGLWELQVITVVMPEHLAALRSLKKKEELVSSLELLDNPDVTATSIEVEWRPPTKNADRIERYKLMMATTSGVVKELTQGRFLRYFVSGLRPASEYIFCVKALYADGSCLWSESKSFFTASR